MLLNSCLDYVQAISYKDGKYTMYYKITFSKMLFSLIDEDPDEYVQEIIPETTDDLSEELANSFTSRKINTTNEVGYELSFSIAPGTTDEQEKQFLPKASGTKCYIPFLPGMEGMDMVSSMNNSDLDSESKSYAQAILSSAKCRVLVSKKIIAKVETAYFEGNGGQNCSVPIFDYGESYCVEIPFNLLFENNLYNFSRIVLIRGE